MLTHIKGKEQRPFVSIIVQYNLHNEVEEFMEHQDMYSEQSSDNHGENRQRRGSIRTATFTPSDSAEQGGLQPYLSNPATFF